MDRDVVRCEGSSVSKIAEGLFVRAGLVHHAREIDQNRHAVGRAGQRALEHGSRLVVAAMADVELPQSKQ